MAAALDVAGGGFCIFQCTKNEHLLLYHLEGLKKEGLAKVL